MFDLVKDNLVPIVFGAIGGILGVGLLKGATMLYDKIAGTPTNVPTPSATVNQPTTNVQPQGA